MPELTHYMTHDMTFGVKEINAVQLRQGLKRVARGLEATGEPVLLKVGRKPVGVIISLQDFEERFVLRQAEEARRQLVEEILSERRSAEGDVDEALEELRSG